MNDEDAMMWKMVKLATVTALLSIVLAMGGCPVYGVWQQGQTGKAELRRAEQNRQIAVQEAQAKMESSSLYAQAEVERDALKAEVERLNAFVLASTATVKQLMAEKAAGLRSQSGLP